MLEAVTWLLTSLAGGVIDAGRAIANPSLWLDWSSGEALMRFIYYGASIELLFVVIDIVLILFIAGLVWRRLLWGVVRGLEAVNNAVGRVFAWAALIMVVQQVMIVLLQRVFRVSEITLGPFGYVFTRDLSWYSEELKLYNAIIVALCAGYTFVQGGHVRVDLFYAGMRHRAKKIVDMLGSLVFMLPLSLFIWFYGWFFLWRHLVTPKVSATDEFDLLLRKATILRWNVETIGFAPNGFDAYFLFKVLMVLFAGLIFIQAIAFFFRSYLEWVEGEAAAGRYLDRDGREGDAEPAAAADDATPPGAASSA